MWAPIYFYLHWLSTDTDTGFTDCPMDLRFYCPCISSPWLLTFCKTYTYKYDICEKSSPMSKSQDSYSMNMNGQWISKSMTFLPVQNSVLYISIIPHDFYLNLPYRAKPFGDKLVLFWIHHVILNLCGSRVLGHPGAIRWMNDFPKLFWYHWLPAEPVLQHLQMETSDLLITGKAPWLQFFFLFHQMQDSSLPLINLDEIHPSTEWY